MLNFELESKFDYALNRAIPLILFSFPRQSSKYIEKLYMLYDMMFSNELALFEQIYNDFNNIVEGRDILEKKREDFINYFNMRKKTFDDKIWLLHERISKLEKKLGKKTKDKKKLLNFTPSEKIEDVLVKSTKKSKITRKSNDGIDKTCPKCGNIWNFTGKGYRIKDKVRIQCPRCKQFFMELVN